MATVVSPVGAIASLREVLVLVAQQFPSVVRTLKHAIVAAPCAHKTCLVHVLRTMKHAIVAHRQGDEGRGSGGRSTPDKQGG